MDHDGLRHFDAVPAEKLVQVHLVIALENGLLVVDDDQPERGSALGEFVGVMVKEGGIANKERIELAQALDRLTVDDLGAHAERLRRAQELIQRCGIRWRKRLIGVMQYRN